MDSSRDLATVTVWLVFAALLYVGIAGGAFIVLTDSMLGRGDEPIGMLIPGKGCGGVVAGSPSLCLKPK